MDLPDFSKLFHQSSKNLLKGHPLVSVNPSKWPAEWKTIYYKTYPRLPKVVLGEIEIKKDIIDCLKTRRSRRDFKKGSITKDELGTLLKYSCGEMGRPINQTRGRAQPSGGGRFPIETYSIVLRPSGDMPAGLYHYDVRNHALDVLWQRDFDERDCHSLFTYPWVKDATIGIVMTSVFWRNQNKYGERGYRYILLEAGHIGQNIYLVCEALGLKCCALGGTYDENLEKLIDIDGVTESVVYAIALGK